MVARQAVPLVLQRQPPPVADFDRPLKREADKVAECVLAMPARAGAPRVQRTCGECADELRRQSMEGDEEEPLQTRREGADVSVVKVTLASEIGNIRAGGSRLPVSARAFFEPHFGYNCSDVRVHTDSRAADTKALNARAFTIGHDVVFGAGGYAPDSASGRRLLAHELTHVVQQSRGRGVADHPHVQRMCYGGDTDCQSAPPAHGVTQYSARPAPSEERDAAVGDAIEMVRDSRAPGPLSALPCVFPRQLSGRCRRNAASNFRPSRALESGPG